MPFEKVNASQVVTFAPAGPPYTSAILTAGVSQAGTAVSSSPWVVIPPLLSDPTGYPPQTGDVFQLWNSAGVLKEPTLFQVAWVAPDAYWNAWSVYFNPLPAVIPVAGDQVISLSRPTDARWLGAIGHVTGLTYSYVCPGGPDAMTCTLQIPPTYRTDAMNPGRVVQIMRGGGCVWDGILDEAVPSADGWTVTAHGAGNAGTDFADIYTTRTDASGTVTTINSMTVGDKNAVATDKNLSISGTGIPAGATITYVTPGVGYAISIAATASGSPVLSIGDWTNPDDHVNEAIARGLRWKNPGIGTPAGAYLDDPQDSGSETITDFLNLICTGGSLLWDVQEGQSSGLPAGPPQLHVYQYPTDASGNPNGPPTRLLVCTTPVARTIAADINTLVLYYQNTPDIPATAVTPAISGTFITVTVQNTESARQHGVMEYFLDLSSAGVMSLAQVQQVGNNILSRYVRANVVGPFTVGPGQYLNPGGVAVDLGCEHAGEVAQLLVTDGSYGGEVSAVPITFLIGEYAYDNDTDTATVTPFAAVGYDMASLIAALYPNKFDLAFGDPRECQSSPHAVGFYQPGRPAGSRARGLRRRGHDRQRRQSPRGAGSGGHRGRDRRGRRAVHPPAGNTGC